MSDDIHEQVAREIVKVIFGNNVKIDIEVAGTTKILRREYGKREEGISLLTNIADQATDDLASLAAQLEASEMELKIQSITATNATKKVEELLSQLAVAQEALKAILLALEDEPEYHQQGMGCGLEDRSIHDRYDAMQYGWDCAIERFHEILNGFPEIVRKTLDKEKNDGS